MKTTRPFIRSVFVLLAGAAVLFAQPACKTTEPARQPIPAPTLPPLAFVPHPAGMEQADLVQVFTDPQAPDPEKFSKDCDASFKKLKGLARSRDELSQGTSELVNQNPVLFHWCFYSKFLLLETTLSKDIYLDEKQKIILNTYEFISPVARTFMREFKDSRYLRFASYRYERYSANFFMRKTELTAVGTSELVQSMNPFDQWRAPSQLFPVLDKYRLDVKDIKVQPAGETGLEQDLLAAPVPTPSPIPVVEETPPAVAPAPEPATAPTASLDPELDDVPEKAKAKTSAKAAPISAPGATPPPAAATIDDGGLD